MGQASQEESGLRLFEFRFVVLLRGEGRECRAPEIPWRGWIQRVPDISELAAPMPLEQVAFGKLEEIPEIVRSLMGARP